MTETSAGLGDDLSRLDTSVAHSARLWNYLLGGKDNFAADREAAQQVLAFMPELVESARASAFSVGASGKSAEEEQREAARKAAEQRDKQITLLERIAGKEGGGVDPNTQAVMTQLAIKRATGLTFTDYLARVRIEKAKTLLLERNRRISEIAYDVGFQSLTHFNRIFKKLVGASPSSYRRSASKLAWP